MESKTAARWTQRKREIIGLSKRRAIASKNMGQIGSLKFKKTKTKDKFIASKTLDLEGKNELIGSLKPNKKSGSWQARHRIFGDKNTDEIGSSKTEHRIFEIQNLKKTVYLKAKCWVTDRKNWKDLLIQSQTFPYWK